MTSLSLMRDAVVVERDVHVQQQGVQQVQQDAVHVQQLDSVARVTVTPATSPSSGGGSSSSTTSSKQQQQRKRKRNRKKKNKKKRKAKTLVVDDRWHALQGVAQRWAPSRTAKRMAELVAGEDGDALSVLERQLLSGGNVLQHATQQYGGQTDAVPSRVARAKAMVEDVQLPRLPELAVAAERAAYGLRRAGGSWATLFVEWEAGQLLEQLKQLGEGGEVDADFGPAVEAFVGVLREEHEWHHELEWNQFAVSTLGFVMDVCAAVGCTDELCALNDWLLAELEALFEREQQASAEPEFSRVGQELDACCNEVARARLLAVTATRLMDERAGKYVRNALTLLTQAGQAHAPLAVLERLAMVSVKIFADPVPCLVVCMALSKPMMAPVLYVGEYCDLVEQAPKTIGGQDLDVSVFQAEVNVSDCVLPGTGVALAVLCFDLRQRRSDPTGLPSDSSLAVAIGAAGHLVANCQVPNAPALSHSRRVTSAVLASFALFAARSGGDPTTLGKVMLDVAGEDALAATDARFALILARSQLGVNDAELHAECVDVVKAYANANPLTHADQAAVWLALARMLQFYSGGYAAPAALAYLRMIDAAMRAGERGELEDMFMRAAVSLAGLYQEQGESEQAVAMLEHAVGACGGAGDALLADMLGNLGNMYLEGGDLAKAERVLAQALAIREPLQGKLHVSTLALRGSMADVSLKRGDKEHAAHAFKQLAADARSVLGTQHATTVAFQRKCRVLRKWM